MNIAILLGRHNSKSVKGKNVYNFFGKPAFTYPLRAALKCKNISKIYVSTDSPEIAAVEHLCISHRLEVNGSGCQTRVVGD